MYFRILVEIAVLVYVSLAMLAPEFKPKMTKLSWAVIIFGIIIFITGITGVDFYKTFWGTVERGEGFLTLSHLIIYFLILTWTLKSKQEWLNYLTAIVVVGILVDFYAILQRANVEYFFLFGRIIHSGEGRLSATIGNAAFMGAYTLVNFFLSLLLFLKRKHLVWKFIFAAATLLNFFILFQTQTRGALLAWLLVSSLLCLFYALKSPGKIKKNIAIGVLVSIILASLIIWLNKDSQWVEKNETLKRLVRISRSDITTESRIFAFDSSLKGWKDRFLLGYGWENYNIAFNKYFHAEIYKDQGSQLWFDRAHNTIFDVAVTTGIFGLICYLAIFGLAIFEIYKYSGINDFDTSAILSALLLAHFLQNIFVFDVLATYIILFAVLAFVAGQIKCHPELVSESISKTRKSRNEFGMTNKPGMTNTNAKFNIIIFTSVLLIVIFSVYVFNIKPLQANDLSVKALIAANNEDIKQMMIFFQKTILMNTYQTPEIIQKLADQIIYHNKTKNNLTQLEVNENFKFTIQEIKNNIQSHPLDVQNYLYLMAVLNKAADYNPDYLQEVIDFGQKALVLSPTRPQIYFEMGQASIMQKKFEQGIEYFKKGLALNPKTLESHWNLMTAYIIVHQNDKANEEYEYLENHGYDFDNNAQLLNRLYSIYLTAGQKNKMAEVLEKIVKLEPAGKNYARLAAAYKEIGEIEKAKQAVMKAVELDPSLANEAQQFIQGLE